MRPGSYGVLGFLLLSCDTLGTALSQVLRFEGLVHDLGRSQVSVKGTRVRFVWTPQPEFDSPLLVEVVFAGMQAFSSWLSGRQLPLLKVELTAQGCSSPLQDRAHVMPLLGCAENALEFSVALMDWPLSQSDTSLFTPLQAWAESRLREKRCQASQLQQQLHEWFRRQLPSWPDLAKAARDLGVSERSLQRYLQGLGSSFQQERDRMRQAMATDYVAHSGLSMTEIALLLGYRETGAFSAAFRKWFGTSPREFREQSLLDQRIGSPCRPDQHTGL
jgi:AraC-like DNA-binding protein